MGVRSRMRLLNQPQRLLGIRFGPGAAILPKDVKRIHLDFAVNWNNGHLGPRRFWRDYLPRLKYHNPMVSMTVQRTPDQAAKPVMTIHYDNETSKTIDMQMKKSTDILDEFMTITNATQVEPSSEEVERLAEVEQQKAMSEKDKLGMLRVKAKRMEEKRLVQEALKATA